jgi:lipopolysaccharide biosynthesis protein
MKNAILLHLHYQDYWPIFWNYLKQIKDDNLDIFATVHTIDTDYYIDIKNNVNEVFLMDNIGVDFGGFLFAYNKIKNTNYKTITKLHGKRRHYYRQHTPETWAKILYEPLIEKENHTAMLNSFYNNDLLFIYGSKGFHAQENHIQEKSGDVYFDQNIRAFNKINEVLNLNPLKKSDFIVGSMFTVSAYYLDLFFKGKEMEIFELMEPSFPFPCNGTIAHALERMIPTCITDFGGTAKYI